jgi:hypothetical protein
MCDVLCLFSAWDGPAHLVAAENSRLAVPPEEHVRRRVRQRSPPRARQLLLRQRSKVRGRMEKQHETWKGTYTKHNIKAYNEIFFVSP